MFRLAPLLFASLAATAAGAEPLAVGSALPALELEDQHGEKRALDASLRLVLFSRDMDGGDVIKQALAVDGPAFLERNAAVYVADVSGMPGIVLRLMARPAMRRRAYPMLLDTEGGPTAGFPAEKGRATLIFVDALRVVRIEYVDSPDALLEAVEPRSEAEEPGEPD